MKKYHFSTALITLLFVSSLSTANVDFMVSSPSDGLITIGYTADEDAGVRGIAMNISLSNNATAVYTDIVSVHPAFNAFIDYAYTYGIDYEIGDGHPFAYPNQAGALEVPASYFSIVMGHLDESENQDPAPAVVENLITFRVQDGGAGFTCMATQEDLSIHGDILRGGVFGDNIGTVTFAFAQPYVMMLSEVTSPPVTLIVNDEQPCFSGKIVSVNWPGTMSEYIKLQYSTDNGSDWQNLGQSMYQAGPVYWKIPDEIDSENCLVRAVSLDETTEYGISDSAFSIRPCSVEMDVTGDCFVDFHDLAIFAGEWLKGQRYEN